MKQPRQQAKALSFCKPIVGKWIWLAGPGIFRLNLKSIVVTTFRNICRLWQEGLLKTGMKRIGFYTISEKQLVIVWPKIITGFFMNLLTNTEWGFILNLEARIRHLLMHCVSWGSAIFRRVNSGPWPIHIA